MTEVERKRKKLASKKAVKLSVHVILTFFEREQLKIVIHKI